MATVNDSIREKILSRKGLITAGSVLVIVMSVTFLVLSVSSQNHAQKEIGEAIELLKNEINTSKQLLESTSLTSQADMISSANALQQLISANPQILDSQQELEYFVKSQDLEEIYISDANGKVIASVPEEAKGLSFTDFPPTRRYMHLINHKNLIISEICRCNDGISENGQSKQFAAVSRSDADGIIQVVRPIAHYKNSAEALDKKHIAENFTFGKGGFVAVVSSSEIISSSNPDIVGKSVAEIPCFTQGTDETYKARLDNTEYMITEEKYESYELYAFLPTSQVFYNRNLVILCMMIAFLSTLAIMMVYSQRSLEKEHIQVNKNIAKANEANQSKSNFLSRMSHDIRTPINGIMGMLDIASRNIDDKDKVEDCIDKMKISSHHLLSLINDVLDMSKLESGKVELLNEPFSIKQLAEDCASVTRLSLIERNLTLNCSFDNIRHPYLWGSELHIKQIFMNLLGNAVKYTKDGGSIAFTVDETESTDDTASFRFIVSDTGIGISEEFLPKLFNSFAQERSKDRTTYKGTGLGMAIVKMLIDLMGGKIDVSSTLGVGSTFTVYLSFPINKNYIGEAEQGSVKDFSILNKKKVLLAEDNEINREIAEFLLNNNGLEVVNATDGKQAVEIFEASKPNEFDVILMDIMMPIMNGYEATAEIRKLAREDAQTVPIIAMTANAFAEDIKTATESGMNAHIAKPIIEEKMLETIKRVLTEANAAKQ